MTQDRPRDVGVDNAKGVLIGLVTLGHFLEALNGWDDPGPRLVLTVLYAFHMPAFVFLAGLTAGPAWSWRRVVELAILLIVFQAAYLAPHALHGGLALRTVAQPFWLLWFLLSVIWWRVLTPLLRRMPHPLLLATALALSVGLLPWVGYGLSLSRTFVFLPFFVAGALYGWPLLERVRNIGVARWAGLAVIPLGGLLLFAAGVSPPWLYGASGFGALGVSPATGLAIRAGLLAVAAAGAAAFLAVMPRRAGAVSRIGAASLPIYLLHGFVVKLAQHLAALGRHPPRGWAALGLAVAMTLVCVTVFSQPIWGRALRRVAALASPRPAA